MVRETLARHHRDLVRQHAVKWIDDYSLDRWKMPPRAHEASAMSILIYLAQSEAQLAEVTKHDEDISAVLITADKVAATLRALSKDDGLVSGQSV